MKRLACTILALFAVSTASYAAVDPIPCAVGNRWEFDCVKLSKGSIEYQGRKLAEMYDTSSGTSVYEITSVDTASVPIYTYKESTSTRSTISGRSSNEYSLMRLSTDSEGLKIHATESSAGDGDEVDRQAYDPPLLYWLKNASPGKSWDVGTIRGQSTQEPLNARVVGRETVTVPAGTFKDCLKVVYSSDTASGSLELMGQQFAVTSGKSRGVYWIADGVGIVKELEVSTSSAQAPGPAGGSITLDGATCTITELKPGYVVK